MSSVETRGYLVKITLYFVLIEKREAREKEKDLNL
jgi:hypothetical protein